MVCQKGGENKVIQSQTFDSYQRLRLSLRRIAEVISIDIKKPALVNYEFMAAGFFKEILTWSFSLVID